MATRRFSKIWICAKDFSICLLTKSEWWAGHQLTLPTIKSDIQFFFTIPKQFATEGEGTFHPIDYFWKQLLLIVPANSWVPAPMQNGRANRMEEKNFYQLSRKMTTIIQTPSHSEIINSLGTTGCFIRDRAGV